jgi:D-alanine transfer protein
LDGADPDGYNQASFRTGGVAEGAPSVPLPPGRMDQIMQAHPTGTGRDQAPRPRRPIGVFAAILALTIVVVGARGSQIYAQSLAAHYVRALATADLPIKYLSLTFQRAALTEADVLPVYGSSELYWANDPRRAPQFFQSAPTGFSVFAVGHAGTSDLLFLQTFAALGADLRGKSLVVEDSAVWFYNPTAVPWDQYGGNFSPEIASMFLFDSPVSLDVREAGAWRMLDFPSTLQGDDLLRAATESLADPSLPHLLAYYALYPAGWIESWVRQVQDAGQTIAFIRSNPDLQPDPPRQARPVNWSAELQAASAQAKSQSTNNPFGISDEGFHVLKANVDLSEVYSALALYCFDKTNRTGAVYGYPAAWESTMRSSLAWGDLQLEIEVLRELGAHPLVVGLPLDGAYDDYTPISQPARQDLYNLYRATTADGGVATVDLSGFDEDSFFLHDPLDHLSPRGWVFVDRALDIFWHHGSVGSIGPALGGMAAEVPPPALPSPASFCGMGGPPPGPAPTASNGPAGSLQPPWGSGQSPAFLINNDFILTNVTAPATGATGGSIAVTAKTLAFRNLSYHFIVDARLIDGSGAIRGEATQSEAPLDQPPATKFGDTHDFTLSLPVPADAPRGVYHVEVAVFHIPSWRALPITRIGGTVVNQVTVGNVLIAPADYLPTGTLPSLGGTVQPLSFGLGGELDLVGATPIRRVGDQLSFDLFWRAAHALNHDDTISVQVLDRNGRLVAQSDSYPWGGRYPTSAWLPGRIVRDTYQLALPPGLPAGPYRVIVGAYRLQTMQRLTVVDASGAAIGDHVSLATIDIP